LISKINFVFGRSSKDYAINGYNEDEVESSRQNPINENDSNDEDDENKDGHRKTLTNSHRKHDDIQHHIVAVVDDDDDDDENNTNNNNNNNQENITKHKQVKSSDRVEVQVIEEDDLSLNI